MEPTRTFKFAKINDRLIQSLIKSEIYFSVPEKLNDPFDCRINVKKALDNAISQSAEPERRFLRRVASEPVCSKRGRRYIVKA